MTTMTCELSMTLDGFVAHRDDTVEQVFDWYAAGPVEQTTAKPELTFHIDEASAEHIRTTWAQIGCHLVGRRLFDITDGWGGQHPIDVPVVVVTHRDARDWIDAHPDAPFTFVGDVETGIAAAKRIAGDRNVTVAGPSVIQQVINLGEMDEINVSLVPFLIGSGIRFFGDLIDGPVALSDPEIVPGRLVTHLRYVVKR